MFNWFKKKKSNTAKYHDAKLELDSYLEATSNLTTFSDVQIDKKHDLIKNVRRLEKLAKSEVKLI